MKENNNKKEVKIAKALSEKLKKIVNVSSKYNLHAKHKIIHKQY